MGSTRWWPRPGLADRGHHGCLTSLDADDREVRVLVEVHPHVDELLRVRETVLGAVPQRDQRQVVTDRDLLGLLVGLDAVRLVLVALRLLEQVVELLVR